jgi:uncharacterized LabA/DUF88 family protein
VDQSAVFVDAGYVLAEGGRLTCGTTSRPAFTCDYHGLTQALAQWVHSHSSGMPSLRTYWYDGAARGVPTADHELIGGFAYVKVRLGRVVHGEQKGVDALIYRDLMTLARERAITRAYLLSGDEDLREGVVAAQDMGVQVVLLGVPTSQRANQSAPLIREADEHVVLPKDFWDSFFARKEASAEEPGIAPETKPEATKPEEAAPGPAEAQTAGRAFAVQWMNGVEATEVSDLLRQFPRIPRELDLTLLLDAEKTLGSLRERQDLKREVRGAFWAALQAGTTEGP